jgi:hypothetical protein
MPFSVAAYALGVAPCSWGRQRARQPWRMTPGCYARWVGGANEGGSHDITPVPARPGFNQ